MYINQNSQLSRDIKGASFRLSIPGQVVTLTLKLMNFSDTHAWCLGWKNVQYVTSVFCVFPGWVEYSIQTNVSNAWSPWTCFLCRKNQKTSRIERKFLEQDNPAGKIWTPSSSSCHMGTNEIQMHSCKSFNPLQLLRPELCWNWFVLMYKCNFRYI